MLIITRFPSVVEPCRCAILLTAPSTHRHWAKSMTTWKMPPKAKVYEALSAVADGRVRITGERTAEVTSSSGDKKYRISWGEGFSTVMSDDNASLFQGYIGYPIIAVLLQVGRLSHNKDIAAALAGVPWKVLNTKFKRDYNRAVDSVLEEIGERGGPRIEIVREADLIYEQLGNLALQRPG